MSSTRNRRLSSGKAEAKHSNISSQWKGMEAVLLFLKSVFIIDTAVPIETKITQSLVREHVTQRRLDESGA